MAAKTAERRRLWFLSLVVTALADTTAFPLVTLLTRAFPFSRPIAITVAAPVTMTRALAATGTLFTLLSKRPFGTAELELLDTQECVKVFRQILLLANAVRGVRDRHREEVPVSGK